MNIEGIQCDNKNCDYEDDTVVVQDYKDWLNKPCPCCGANLLTEKDYKLVLAIKRFENSPLIQGLNKLYDKLNKPKVIVEAEMNGTGTIRIKDEQ